MRIPERKHDFESILRTFNENPRAKTRFWLYGPNTFVKYDTFWSRTLNSVRYYDTFWSRTLSDPPPWGARFLASYSKTHDKTRGFWWFLRIVRRGLSGEGDMGERINPLPGSSNTHDRRSADLPCFWGNPRYLLWFSGNPRYLPCFSRNPIDIYCCFPEQLLEIHFLGM